MILYREVIKTAKKDPKKIAIYDQATGKDISYEKLVIAALILGKKFTNFREKYIGIMVPTSAGCILANLGVLLADKIPVMINYSTGARQNSIYAQEKCSFQTIITSKKMLSKLKIKPVSGMLFLEDIMAGVTALDKAEAFLKYKLPLKGLLSILPKSSREDTAVILFTSGSERDPKAVQLTHKNIMHNVINLPQIIDITNQEIFAGILPLFHVFGLTTNFWLPLIVGASIVTHANPLEYKKIVDSIKRYKISVLIGTPSFFHGYLRKSQKGDFESIKHAIAGADKLTAHLRDNYRKLHGIDVLEGYGTTETSPVIAVNVPEDNRPGSVGRPAPGVEVKIVDHETDEEQPPGKEGKILVKGDLVMKGYLGDLEQTSLRIHRGWYDTGDMGILDEDGFLWHRGRLKRFVKVGGEMVSLVKVEEELNKLLPDDVVCCVVDVPNPTKGADIVAAVTTGEIEHKKIMKKLKKVLPTIAVPREFHVIEDIPMMGSGKVNFREVEKICRTWQKNGKAQKL
jgi:acyl-[acyl-carrier-protein]-phospholipid O-acyltransferase/long-chain-fatty-acid--[acyl-carrier-protein] ligase